MRSRVKEEPRPPNLTLVEDTLYVVDAPVGLSKYDFDFSLHFACSHPAWLDAPITAVARMGAAPDYLARFDEMKRWGITLIHTPEQYERTSLLPRWYPLLEGLTPRSHWFESVPEPEEVEALFDYPIFVKGERQTHKHRRDSSIMETPEQLRRVLADWRRDPILGWQRVVAREFLRLRPVAQDLGAGLPRVFEFRSFWWKGTCVGVGPYWNTPAYGLQAHEEEDLLELGAQAARRVDVPFLVLDVAQTVEGTWTVIECNDGQDSGYMGVDRVQMWRRILALERGLVIRM